MQSASFAHMPRRSMAKLLAHLASLVKQMRTSNSKRADYIRPTLANSFFFCHALINI
jgi:hypothetical protein